MRRSLAAWLAFIEQQHPSAIALGLERVAQVRANMDLAIAAPAFTVAGTNGKGSTCAMLDAILRAAGYRTGLYTSPHLARYNERVRIAGREAGDDALVEGFEAVERARDDVPLTYFEYGTLAALWLFAREAPDALVLEVGLGGRLDAVNLVDADCAVLTSVATNAPVLLRPIASGPPVAASAPEEAEITLANNEAAASTPPMTGEPAAQPAPIPEPAKAPGQPVPASSPQPILPDDTRRKLQSQDFLPLFRFPGTGNNAEDVTVIVPGVPTPPAPSNLPPSSATYQQR